MNAWIRSPWTKTAAALLACGACFALGRAAAQEEPAGGGAEAGAFEMPEWTQKGPEHEEMARLAGDWDVTTRIWMAPGQPPMESGGSATTELLYDGRFVRQSMQADMMGVPFEGTWIGGYDRVSAEYVSIWFDSMSTYLSVSRGKPDGEAVVYEMNDPDWMTGEKKKTRLRMEWSGDDAYLLTFLDKGPDGADVKQMEIGFKRRKAADDSGE